MFASKWWNLTLAPIEHQTDIQLFTLVSFVRLKRLKTTRRRCINLTNVIPYNTISPPPFCFPYF